MDRQHRSQGVVVLGISSEDSVTQRQFAQLEGVSYPLLVNSGGMAEPYAKVFALPTTFVIDRKGILRDVLVGHQKGVLERVVEGLLQKR